MGQFDLHGCSVSGAPQFLEQLGDQERCYSLADWTKSVLVAVAPGAYVGIETHAYYGFPYPIRDIESYYRMGGDGWNAAIGLEIR